MVKLKVKFDWRMLLLLPVPLLWAFVSQRGELGFFDDLLLQYRFSFRGEIDSPVKVIYVDIDQQAIEQLGNFPWPRSHFAEVGKALTVQGKVKAVGIDAVFSEKGISEAYDWPKWIEGNVKFFRFLQSTPPMVLAASYTARETKDKKGNRVPIPFPMLRDGLPPLEAIEPPEVPYFSLAENRKWNPPRIGLIDTIDDGTRWVPLFAPTAMNVYERYDHMALALALLYWGVDPAKVSISDTAIEVPNPAGGLLARIPLVDRQLLEVNWFSRWLSKKNPRESFANVLNYARALSSEKESERENAARFFQQFERSVVLIGPVDPLLQDLAVTPVDAVPVPKVGVHGNLLKTIVSGEYLRRLPLWGLYVLTFSLSVSVTVLSLVGGARGLWSRMAALGLLLGFVALSFALFKTNHLVLPMAAPLGGAFSTAFLGIAWQLILEEKQKSRIKSMFGSYLAPELVNQMIESKTPPELGGHKKIVTGYFSDIQGFSTFSLDMTPKELVDLMNEYLTACSIIIQEERGMLDKYIGDAVVAFFGAPVELPDHAYRACVATVRVQARIDELREKWKREGGWPDKVYKLRARLGLNTGEVIIGNMGSNGNEVVPPRLSYTMMGEHVNLAARMESGAKAWGAFTMVTEATKVECERHGGDHVVFRPLARIVVAGFAEAVPVHEIVGLKENISSQTRECLGLFEQGRARYYARDWDGAIKLFEQSAKLEPLVVGVAPGVKGNPSTAYLEICQVCKKSPPPDNWNGVHVMKEK